MREWTPQSHLEEAFRKVLFRLVNQYLSFPEDAAHGKIVRTLVAFQQARAALEGCAGALVLRTRSVESCHPHGRATKPQAALLRVGNPRNRQVDARDVRHVHA